MNQTKNLGFTGYQPGCLASLCAIQIGYYARNWGFNHLYESVVALSIGEFLQRYNPDRDFVQLVTQDNTVRGGIVIDSLDGEMAQLHWFILEESLKGHGLGRELLNRAMDFVTAQQIKDVCLMTFKGLDPARKLYEEVGFKLVSEQLATTWGNNVVEQRFEWQA